MSSWLHCPCGKLIHKNMFCGAGVALLVPEAVLDADFTGVTAEAFINTTLQPQPMVLECSVCQRLFVVDELGKNPLRVYRREEAAGEGEAT